MTKTTRALAALSLVAGIGLAALPLSTYAEESQNIKPVDVSINVPDELYVTVSATSVELKGSGTNSHYRNDELLKVDVESTHPSGYKLTMVGSGSGANKTSLYNERQTEIATGAFSEGELETSVWGYITHDYDRSGNYGTENTAVASSTTDSSAVLDSYTQATKNRSMWVQFNARIAAGQEAGEYKGQVTFTATPNA